MNYPKTIKIGGHLYQLKLPYTFKERYDRNAQIDHDRCHIMVSCRDVNGNQRSETVVIESVIHEILHGFNYRAGDMIFSKDEKAREDQISALSEGILALLVDNGWLKLEATDGD